MRSGKTKTYIFAVLIGLFLVGCADAEPVEPIAEESSDRDQAVTVVPEFQIKGVSALPDELRLEELGLTISEIQFEPLDTDSEAPAYSTREPTPLAFDIADNQTIRRGERLGLPREGTYLINVRLEPVTEVEQVEDGAVERVYSSFSVAGSVAGEAAAQRTVFNDSTTTGEPIPLPYDVDRSDDEEGESDSAQTEEGTTADTWTSFHYDSDRSVFMTLGEVDLREGEQVLSFEFDVSQWALALLEPLLDALEDGDDLHYDNGAVDVSTPLESHGHGAESLLDDAQVDSM